METCRPPLLRSVLEINVFLHVRLQFVPTGCHCIKTDMPDGGQQSRDETRRIHVCPQHASRRTVSGSSAEKDNNDVCSSLLSSITNNQCAGRSTDQYVFNGGGRRQQTEPDWICVQLVRVVLVVASSRGALEVLGALLLPAPVKAPFSTVGLKTAERSASRNNWTQFDPRQLQTLTGTPDFPVQLRWV